MTTKNLIEAASFRPIIPSGPSAWMGHLHFAAWVIREVKPQIFVELGTHAGHSYFSFCQAVTESGLPTRCFAVDTWAGDGITTGHYSDEIYNEVNSFNQERYASFSHLLRMTFDDALTHFADESVELLHIDGLHTYEAVRHDFETWRPKLAPGAVVLFHDTQVHAENFGVHKFWQELTEIYPRNLEFVHSSGLGVLQIDGAAGGNKFAWLQPESLDKQGIINYFAALGQQQYERYDSTILKEQISKLEKIVADQAIKITNARPDYGGARDCGKETLTSKMFMSYEDFLSLMEEDLLEAKKTLSRQGMNYKLYSEKIDNLVHSKSIYSFCFGSKGDKKVYREQNEIKWSAIESRVETHHRWLNKIAQVLTLPKFRLCIEFEDMANDNNDIPIFCYHKKHGQNIVLIPDFEILEQNYYALEMYKDNYIFQEKQDKAIFVGSTTGTNAIENRGCCNTIENINQDPCVRVSAAKYFDGNEDVIFKLPSVVQCDTEETVEYLKSFGFTHYPRVDWNEQFKYKFILSVDGNGPTCTRVAAALLSNSVLLKYNSRWIVYYHRALRPYYNYIPVAWHDDIHDVLGQIKDNYSFYAAISRQASEDFSLLLKKANVDRYFAVALNEYYALFFGRDDTYWENRLKLDQVAHFDIEAHFSNVGDVWLYPSMTVEHHSGNCIEGLTITPASNLFDWSDISYQVMFEDGSISEMVHGGKFAGSKSKSSKIIGFKMVAKSKYRFSLLYSGIFENGNMRKVYEGEWLRCDNAPIKGIVFHLYTAFA